MSLAFDHVNVRTANLDRLREFYVEVIGLRVGPRPAFSFGGAWLYCGDVPSLHLVEVERPPSARDDLALEHFAFRATGLAEFLHRLRARNVAVRLGFIPDFGICQVNVHDTDGNHLHVDFPIDEARALHLEVP